MQTVALAPPEILGFVRSFAGGGNGRVSSLAGQASTRRYHRVVTAGQPASCVVMELPEDDRKLAEGSYPFLNLHHYLARLSYPVPRIYRTALAEGLIALEDLGDQTLEQAVRSASGDPAAVARLYRTAMALIARLQRLGAENPDPACLAFGRRFDHQLLRWELDHFREWLLEEDRKVTLSELERAELIRSFDLIAHELAGSPAVLVHRDFQSRNIMVLEGSNPPELRVIDFQDALLGPQVYDLVALLRDSYVEVDAQQVFDFIDEFSDLVQLPPDRARRLFHLQTVQRKLKDAGRFVFIDRKRGNPNFLPSIPLSLKYVASALRELPDLSALTEVLARHVPELRPRD